MTVPEYLTAKYQICARRIGCDGCPFEEARGEFSCNEFESLYPEKAEKIMEQWMSENGITNTNGKLFEDTFGIKIGDLLDMDHGSITSWIFAEYGKK